MTTRVEVRSGALADLAGILDPATLDLVVTDSNVEPLVPPAFAHLPRHVIPPGEASKSWSGLEALLLTLDAAGVDRDGQVLAVGGGVVTDLTGLAASLHRRGVAWSAAATSLVGQVDAAVGGKTAVNLGGGKNTVGTFHPPRVVVVDPRALASLPARHLRAGLAEVLKTALIAGPPLYDQVLALELDDLTRAGPLVVAVLEACLQTKLGLVEDDPTDLGSRRLLNLGHTFGHAFEALAMPELLHGEAVGLGLLCAARCAAALPGATPGLEAQLSARLAAWGLPCRHQTDVEAALAQMGRDKKRLGGQLTLVLPLAPGHVVIREGLETGAARAALEAVRPGA